MNEVNEIVNMLLQQIKDHPEYNYISVRDLIHDTGMDIDQIEFMDLFHIQKRLEEEAKKVGIKLDYSEFDGMLSGVPFNLPAVVIRPRCSRSAQRCRLRSVQWLFLRRGDNRCTNLPSAVFLRVESIQPKQSASSTTSV